MRGSRKASVTGAGSGEGCMAQDGAEEGGTASCRISSARPSSVDSLLREVGPCYALPKGCTPLCSVPHTCPLFIFPAGLQAPWGQDRAFLFISFFPGLSAEDIMRAQ